MSLKMDVVEQWRRGTQFIGGGGGGGGGGQTNWSQTQQKQHNTQYVNPLTFIHSTSVPTLWNNKQGRQLKLSLTAHPVSQLCFS